MEVETITPDAPIVQPTPIDIAPSRLSGMSSEERLEWRKTGTMPAKDPTPHADPSTATEVKELPVSTEMTAQPASEPGDYKTKTAKDIQRLLERASKAEERAARVERELMAMRTRPADASTATSDPEPDVTKYDDLTKYQRDMALWGGREALRLRDGEVSKRAATTHIEAETQRMRANWVDKWAASAAKHADFAEVVGGPTEIPEESLVHAFVVDKPEGTEVLYYFQQKANRAELHKVLAMDRWDQVAHLKHLAEKLTAAPTKKMITTAPDPSPTLGVRGSDALDETSRAIKGKDVRGYMKAQNAKDLAARGKR